MVFDNNLIRKIKELKTAKNAVVFAHNYQKPEIHNISDFIGDSFYLAQKARELKLKRVVFCGVTFMAEMVKILSPKTRVFIPSKQAVCPMAASITKEILADLKAKHKNAKVLGYVNTTADTKTLCDVCCTSSNAVQIANKMPTDEIIFIPDQNLAEYVQSLSKKKIISSNGFCYVHSKIDEEKVLEAKKNYPSACLIVHPECRFEVIKHADMVLSTSGMISYAKKSTANVFIVATEIGMVELLQKEVPDKKFFGVGGECIQQKKINLENLFKCLSDETNEILLSKEVIEKARVPLAKMLEYGRND